MVRGAARCVRQHHPRADNYFLGNWLCRDPGHVTRCPPVLAGLGRVDRGPTAVVAPHFPENIEKRKGALRRVIKARRVLPLPRERNAIIRRLARLVRFLEGRAVASVWPLSQEIDLRPLCAQLHRAGYVVALPETPPRGEALRFRRWAPQLRLHHGRFGTLYPAGEVITPDIIIVPLLSFDRQGGRLGYGGGYYDRTLALYPHAPAVGYALSRQESDEVPMDSYDQRLSYIVTEREIIQTTRPDRKG